MAGTMRPVRQIAKDTWTISDYLMDSMYLLAGSERALLIDTGLGIGNLQEMIRGITELPVTVVLTHGHLDHAGGADQFESVWMHEADLEVFHSISCQGRRALVQSSAERKKLPVLFPLEEIQPWKTEPVVHPLHDGQVFDLGGRKVTALAAPGHTRGSMVFVDDKTRFLFSGDACNFNLIMAKPLGFEPGKAFDPQAEDRVAKYAASVETCLASLEKLYCMRGSFDWNYTGHLDEIGGQPEDVTLLLDCISCCRKIIQMGDPDRENGNRPHTVTSGRATVTYLMRKIYGV